MQSSPSPDGPFSGPALPRSAGSGQWSAAEPFSARPVIPLLPTWTAWG